MVDKHIKSWFYFCEIYIRFDVKRIKDILPALR
nr:MAG TPA: hypothetical protein [Caudoviricetes sp.]